MSAATARETCPAWCIRDVEADDGVTWHHATPVTVEMSRDEVGMLSGTPAVLELELSRLDLTPPHRSDEDLTAEIAVSGSDGSGSLVQLCLSVEDVEAVAGEMLRLARVANSARFVDGAPT